METNRKNINAAFAKMQQEAKQLGVELLTKPEVFIDDDHLCCVWLQSRKRRQEAISATSSASTWGFLRAFPSD